MPNATVGPSGLEACDVLLVRGKGTVSKLIRFFDQSEVSHAALYLGNERVAEALMNAAGLQVRDLAVSVAGNEWVLARRHVHGDPKAPVEARAKRYLEDGHRYGYEQIVLLALLASTRRLHVTPILGRLLRTVLDSAASILTRLTAGGKEPMICSEFVYRCYREAVPGNEDPYEIHIPMAGEVVHEGLARTPASADRVDAQSLLADARRRGLGVRRPLRMDLEGVPAGAPPGEIEEIGEEYLREVESGLEAAAKGTLPEADDALLRFASALAESRGGAPALETLSTPLSALEAGAADFVTPGDLYRSPSLRDVGRIVLVPS